MAELTAEQLENAANAALAYFFEKGSTFDQSIQDKPLLKKMKDRQKTFPGGNRNIELRVVGDYVTQIMGFTNDDTVTYGNPTTIKVLTYPWKEIHAGIKVPFTELKIDGITVSDSTTGKSTRDVSGADMQRLAGIFENKLADMAEGWARGTNTMFWLDGTQDAKQVPGILSFILDDPTSATVVAGVDQSTNTWWRNRANLAINASTPANQVLINTLQTELRQLRRYGGKPDVMYAGSTFIEALEKEIRANGQYTQDGNTGSQDPSMGDLFFKKIPVFYDPTLDDLGYAKRAYWLDTSTILPMVMDGEDMKTHNPARPEDKYVLYRAITWTGGLICRKRNANGVYAIL